MKVYAVILLVALAGCVRADDGEEPTEPTQPTEPTEGPSSSTTEGTTTREPTVCDTICPFPGPGPEEDALYLPVPENCEQFCICETYFGTLKTCEFHLHFNPEALVCDWPWLAGCDPEATSPLY